MSSSQPEDAARWYADKVRTYGYDHRGLGFRNQSSQAKRFEAMLALGDLDGARILDVGCGFGDFLAYLSERGIETEYTGLEGLPGAPYVCLRLPTGGGKTFTAVQFTCER